MCRGFKFRFCAVGDGGGTLLGWKLRLRRVSAEKEAGCILYRARGNKWRSVFIPVVTWGFVSFFTIFLVTVSDIS